MIIGDLMRLAGWVFCGVLVTVFVFTGVESATEGRAFLGVLQMAGALVLLLVPARRILSN